MPDSSTTAITESAAAKPKAGRAPHPADQHAAERGAAGKGDGARKLDPRIGRRQQLRASPARAPAPARRRCRRRCRTPRRSRAAPAAAASSAPSADQQQDRRQRHRAQRLGARHQRAPRDAVGEQAGRNGEQDEGQRQRGLQQAGLAFGDAEHQHRDDGGRGERDLLGRLRGEVGPGEAVEGRRQAEADWTWRISCKCRLAAVSAVRGRPNPPASRQGWAKPADCREPDAARCSCK